MKNIYTYISLSLITLILATACSFLMTAADAPIREGGTYLTLILGIVFAWSAHKALLMERDHEAHKDAAHSHSAV